MSDDNNIECDFCDTDAKFNFQKIWNKFTINKDGYYREDKSFCGADVEEPINNENVHLCGQHVDKWINDEI